MSNKNLFVEKNKDGTFSVRRPNAERASAIESTQAKAIERARQIDDSATIHVERVRNTDRGHPDKWRKP